MPDEHPPLSKAYIMGYDGLDRAYPIIARAMNPLADGYVLPAMDSALPETVVGGLASTSHLFIEVKPTVSDLRVLWLYRLLPGPWIPSRDYDPQIGPVQVRRRSVRNSNQTASLSATGSITYESQEGSDAVLWEIERIWSNGTGTPAGNPAYPIRTSDTREDQRGPVQTVSQVVVAAGSEVGSLAVDSGTKVATHIEYKALDQYAPYLLNKVTETWTLDTIPIPSTTLERDGTVTYETRTLARSADITSSEAFGGGSWTRVTKEPVTDLISWRVTKVTAAPGTPIVASEPDEDGVVKTTTRTFMALSSITAAEVVATGTWTRTSAEPVTAIMGWKVVESRSATGTVLTSQSLTETVRGKKVDTIVQTGEDGTLDPESGDYVISSATEQISAVLERRTSKKFNGAAYPADEVWYDYQYVSIPRRIFSLDPTYICNGTDQGVTVTFNPVTLPGGSYLRKHRTTVSYSAAAPDDTLLNVFTVADLDYDGRIINHHFHGVLNEEITLDQEFVQGSCTWDEVYDFPASDPTPTDFAEEWWLVSRQTTQFGVSAWRTVTVEFYEPAIPA